MQKIVNKQFSPGTMFTGVFTQQFKTSVCSVVAVLPMQQENACAALLPQVLACGTAQNPDMQSIGAQLDDLYGARIVPIIRKAGENLEIGFIADMIEGAYAGHPSSILEGVAGLISDFWYHPHLTAEGLLQPDTTEREKNNLLVRIGALKTDTRNYANRRLYAHMCKDEPYGWCEYGTKEGTKAVTAEALTAFWKNVCQNAPLQIFYCGGASKDFAEGLFRRLFDKTTGSMGYRQTIQHPAPESPLSVTEKIHATQAKLSLGFRTGLTGLDKAYPALMLFAMMYGGYTGSALFRNLREKRSLCYYASAFLDKFKGIMTVSSGIDEKNFHAAFDESMALLKNLAAGGFTNDELESARRSLLDVLRTKQESVLDMEEFYQGQMAGRLVYDLNSLIHEISALTRQDVLTAAQHIILDTLYFLKGDKQNDSVI